MAQLISSIEEIRLFLSGRSFLRLLLLVLGGGVVNSLFLFYYGFQFSDFGILILGSDWRLFVGWIVSFPLIWAIMATYLLPMKLKGAPADLALVSLLMLVGIYAEQGMRIDRFSILTILNALALFYPMLIHTLVLGSIVGLGEVAWFYDSFIVPKKRLSDFCEFYENKLYRAWMGIPDITVILKDQRIVLSNDGHLSAYVFMFNHPKGLHVQIITFEKGKYATIRSEESDFFAQQVKRTILHELNVRKAIPFLDKVEEDNARLYALRVTRSVAALRGLRTRDKIVLSIGVVLLSLVYLASIFLDLSSDRAFEIGALIVLGIVAELSYRKLKLTRIWQRIAK